MGWVKHGLAAAIGLAVLGFSISLATTPPPDSAPQNQAVLRAAVAPRAVGTPLRFTNPFVLAGSDPAFPSGGHTSEPQGFDLGDVNSGISYTRYLNAAGGFLPYTFRTRPNFDFLAFGISTIPEVTLYGNGKITDTINVLQGSTPTTTAARFSATVTDFLGTQRTGVFRVSVVPIPVAPTMRFAQDQLPVARLGEPYFTNLQVLAAPESGALPLTYSVVGLTSLKPNAVLEDFGLTLTPDGLLYGRPIGDRTGTAQAYLLGITVRATNKSGTNLALARDGSKFDQDFLLIVLDNTQAVSEVMATSCNFSLDIAKSNADSMTYQAVLDPKGENAFSLAGTPFTARIGRNVFSGTFDAKGKVKVPLKSGSTSSTFEVNVSPQRSTLSMKIKNADLGAGINLPSAAAPATQRVVFCFEFKNFRTCDVLEMPVKVRGKKKSVEYKLGVKLEGLSKLIKPVKGAAGAGGFQVLNVIGADRRLNGEEGDQWYVRWMGVPRFLTDKNAISAFPVNEPGIGGSQSKTVMAKIRIGDSFEQDVQATIKSTRARFTAKGTDPGVYSLILDGKTFVHSLITNVLTEGDTGIPQASQSKALTIFRFGMDIPNFSGETGRVIAPNNSQWQAK